MEKEENVCSEVETVRKVTYQGDILSADGGCEAAVIAATICGWVRFREIFYLNEIKIYCKLLYGKRFSLRVKKVFYESYVRPAILYGTEAWCVKECEMGISRRTVGTMLIAICGLQL